MSPRSECGSMTALLECTVLYWRQICRLVPSQRRDISCGQIQQRFSLEFQASQVLLSSVPLSSILGAADIYLDGVWSGQLDLGPHNTPWFTHSLDSNTSHILTIFPTASLPMDLFVLTLSNRTKFSDLLIDTDANPRLDWNRDLASEKDGSSGAIISLVSLAAVVTVVLVCSLCFFLNRSRRRPGFHMPSVLVNNSTSHESNMDADMDMDISNDQENNRKRHGYERYELSTMFSTGTTTTTTKSTWRDIDDRPSEFELQYEYHSRSQPQTRSSMIIPPSNVYTSSSSQTQAPGSETPKRRLSWHEDQAQAMNS